MKEMITYESLPELLDSAVRKTKRVSSSSSWKDEQEWSEKRQKAWDGCYDAVA